MPGVTHLAYQVQQEQQGTIRYPGQTRPETPVQAATFVFILNVLLNFLPVHSEGRITQQEVSLQVRQLVVIEGVAKFDVADVLVLDQHVGHADCVRLRVQLLTQQRHADVAGHVLDVSVTLRQEPTGAGCRVIDGDDTAWFQLVFLAGHDQRGGQVHDVPGSEVLTSCFVGAFGEASDEFLKYQAHLKVTDPAGAQVDVSETPDHLVKQVAAAELLHSFFEAEVVEDLSGVAAE